MVGYEKDKLLSNYEPIVAGFASGFITRALFQPIDVVKIKFQLQVEPIANSPGSKYSSVFQAVRTILSEEGIKGLWAGHNPGQLLSITFGIVNFTVFEMLTNRFSKERSGPSHFLCGSISGGAATVISYPFDTIRTRFIAQGRIRSSELTYRSIINGIYTMLRREGVFSPFKGLSPTLIQAMPLSGITFLSHNIFSKIIAENRILSNSSNTLNLSGNALAGALSGFVAKTIMYPFDLLRKRMQLQGFQNARKNFGVNFYCVSLMDCMKKTWKYEGFFGFFKGWTPSVIKAVLTTSSYFTVYSETCKILAKF